MCPAPSAPSLPVKTDPVLTEEGTPVALSNGIPLDEIKRKSFHMLCLAYIAAYWLLPRATVLYVFAGVIAVAVLGDLFRLKSPAFNDWILSRLGGVHRDGEINGLSGLPWTLTGSFLTMLIFRDRPVVTASMLYMAFGDAAAALVGRSLGRHRLIAGKTIEGSAACFAVCLIAGLFFLPWHAAIIGAVLATAIEAVPWPLNDNFWMPLASASLLTIILPFLK